MRDYTAGPVVAKTRALMAQGMDLDELAAALGVSRSTAIDYRSRVRRADNGGVSMRALKQRKYADQSRCPRCWLRGEHICLPTSAVAYTGHSGERHAVAVGIRFC